MRKFLLFLMLCILFTSCQVDVGSKNVDVSTEKENGSSVIGPKLKVTTSTVKLPNCPENASFDMLAISRIDGSKQDDIVLGEDSSLEVPYPTTVKMFKMSKYMVSYNTWYYVYQWAINNGYKFVNKGSEGMYAKGNNAAIYYPFNEGGEPQLEEMPVGSVNWRDAIVWCNALSQMVGKNPVYCADENFSIPIKDATCSTTDFIDVNWDKTPGKIDNPYVNSNANGFRLPSRAEWEYAARKKIDGTCIPGRNIPGDETGSFREPTSTDEANGFIFNQSKVFGEYLWYRSNSGNGVSQTASGKDDSNATILAKLGRYSSAACTFTSGSNRTHLSGGKKPSHLGFYDLSGNLMEWMFEYNLQYGSVYKFASQRAVRGTDFLTDTAWHSSGEYGGMFPLAKLGFRICQNN